MNRRIDLNLLIQVVEHGSYSAAARATDVPKSTISQRITQLEAAVGTGLLRRTSHSFSLTDAGSKLMPHARAINGIAWRIDDMFADQDGELRETLRISCSQAVAQCALSPVVPRCLACHRQVEIQIEPTNRLVDIVGEGFDITIRGHIGPLKDSSLIRRLVAHTEWVWAASPCWLRSNGTPEHPEELSGLGVLCFTQIPDPRTWLFRNDDEQIRVEVSPRLSSDDMVVLRTSAIAAAGITHLPTYVLEPAILPGDLVRIFSGWEGLTGMIAVLTPPKSQSSRLAAGFSAFLATELPPAIRMDRIETAPRKSEPALRT